MRVQMHEFCNTCVKIRPLCPHMIVVITEFLPSVFHALEGVFVNDQLQAGTATVRVLPCEETWYGVTYKEDLESVESAIAQMKKDGIYKEDLWA